MSNNINSDTDFNDLTISNDYQCLVGGTWTAKLVNGETIYTNGTTTYTGPVNLIDGTLNIEDGAVVNGVTVYSATGVTGRMSTGTVTDVAGLLNLVAITSLTG